MKKWLWAVLAVSLLALGACGGNDHNKDTAQSADEKEVEITLPAILFENQDTDKVIADMKEEGIENAHKNDDGSITLRMNESQHREWLAAAREEISQSIDELVEGGKHPSIKKIDHNNNFTEVTISVDKTAYEGSADTLAPLTLGVSGMMYQLYSGIKEKDFHVTVKVLDAETGGQLEEIVYPDALKNKDTENKEDAK